MDFYSFRATEFMLGITRAQDADELYLSHTVHVDGTLVASNFVHLGSFSDVGTYPTGGAGVQSVVINDPSVKVDFVFQLVNAGNASSETVKAALLGTAQQLPGIGGGPSSGGAVSGILEAIPADGIWALVLKGAGKLWDVLSTNCDGPVAVDRLSGPRFVIDNWADDDPSGTISVIERAYGGLDSPEFCGSNSAYRVTWFVQHWRGWSEVLEVSPFPGGNKEFDSTTSVAVASHNGALHVFGASPGFGVTHARTFSGADWKVNLLKYDMFARNDFFHVNPLPPSAISFNDRLYLFVVLDDLSIWPLAYTRDGGSWATSGPRPPIGLTTWQPIATVEFGHRLHIFARDSVTSHLRFTSSSDLLAWTPWQDVPAAGMRPASPVAAAVLGNRLFLFGIYDTGKQQEKVVVVTSTADTLAWTPWDLVENGARPAGRLPVDQPLDVAATTFGDRLYIASRWMAPESESDPGPYVAVNFSGDGANWSGWRMPASTLKFEPASAPALGANGNHVYVLAPLLVLGNPAGTAAHVWAY